MTKFFVYLAKDDAQAEEAYEGIKAFAADNGFNPTARRIYRIKYIHDGVRRSATVGEVETRINEPVIAILEGRNVFLVCTPTRGVVRGIPLLVGDNEVESIEDFDIQ